MITLSVNEAAATFADLIHRVNEEGETATLTDDGKPVARIVPAKRTCTGAELAEAWAGMPHLGEEEAALFEADLQAARSNLPPPKSKWD